MPPLARLNVSASAVNAAISGAAADVPPTTSQPNSSKITYPVFGFELNAMSGTSRQNTVLPPHFVLLDWVGLITPVPFCHDGMRKTLETPPPPPPFTAPVPPHTVSLPPGWRVVPPTPAAYGWPAGSSTARMLVPSR